MGHPSESLMVAAPLHPVWFLLIGRRLWELGRRRGA
jgi:hypothetical protein